MPYVKSSKTLKIIMVIMIFLLIICAFLFYKTKVKDQVAPAKQESIETGETTDKQNNESEIHKAVDKKPLLDYQSIQKEGELKNMMDTRKRDLGVDKSIDMVVKSDETFKIGKNEVSMQEILKKAHTEKGVVYQEKIESSGEVVPKKIDKYGIYIVQPKDNIWNIHFKLLKEFYGKKGINIDPKADEPLNGGVSSGIGKVLKFSETMVMIYNLKDKKMSSNLNLIEPMSKIVIYNMDEVFTLLSDVNYENIDRLQFDGKSIWIPAKE